MPASTFAHEVYSIDLSTLTELKRRWGVSMQAMVVRLSDLLIISESQKIRFFKQFSATGMRKKEPLDGDRDQERPTLMRKLREFLDAQKLILSGEFVVMSRMPPTFVMAAGNLREEVPAVEPISLSSKVVDFTKVLAMKRGDT